MSLSDKLLFGSFGVVSDVADWVCRRIERGPAWLLPALMLLLFTVVGGME